MDILDKVRKLLSLSKSNNINEAAAAASRAQALMMEHSLSMSDVEIEREEAEPVVGHDVLKDMNARRAKSWQVTLLNDCSHANSCRVVVISQSGRHHAGSLQVFGKKRDVDTTTYLFRYFMAEINRLAREWDGDSSRAARSSFRLGAAETIGNRLNAARRKTMAETPASSVGTNAMVHLRNSDREAEEWVERITGGKKYRTGGASDYDGYTSGQRAGRDVDLGSADRKALGKSPEKIGPKER